MSNETRLRRITKPATDLVIINADATGTILLRQNAFFGEMVEASVAQVKQLTEAPSLRDAVESQRAYLREMGSKFRSVTRENIDTIRGAGRDAGEVLRTAVRGLREDASEAIEDAGEAVAEQVAPPTMQPAAPAPAPTY